jgi:tRNA-binding protein
MSTPPITPTTTVDRLFEVDIRVGVIVDAASFPEARKPAYTLRIDFGELGCKRSSAQITACYRPEELVGRQVVAVVNLPPRQVATFVSEVLVLGVPIAGTDQVVLLAPEREVPVGTRIA